MASLRELLPDRLVRDGEGDTSWPPERSGEILLVVQVQNAIYPLSYFC